MTLLTVSDLKTHFFTDEGTVKAVDGVSYSVGAGEVLGIVGESGSGKSVSSLSTMRLIPSPPGKIVSGKIVFEGRSGTRDLVQLSESEMQHISGNEIGMIFQDPMTSLNPYMRISRQLTEVLELHERMKPAEARTVGIDMLKKVGIPDPTRRFDDYPHQLSGGMRQRIMIAMALLCEPRLLIADEPTTALDVTIQAQILDLLDERRRDSGVGVVLITHDLGVVAKMADRVAVMYAGRIVEQGPAESIFSAPAHPYTVGLARSIPKLDGDRNQRLTPIQGSPPSLTNLPSGCPFRPRCPNAKAACEESYPAERELDAGHRVACHETDLDAVRRPT
jgi:peptide/nickel transport system ATP-binding protein/oligopeptide transport system ATP-binding protein